MVRGFLDMAGLQRPQLMHRVRNALAAVPGARNVWDSFTVWYRTQGKGRAQPQAVPDAVMVAFLASLLPGSV